MPYVDFILSDPRTTLGCGDLGVDGWRVSFTAHLADTPHQHVDLTTEEGGLEHLEGTVTLEPRSVAAWLGFENGSLSYWRGSDDDISSTPPSYLVTIRIEDGDCLRLMNAVNAGLKSLRLSISIDKFEYGWEPDGSGKKWDNASNPRVEISGYQFALTH